MGQPTNRYAATVLDLQASLEMMAAAVQTEDEDSYLYLLLEGMDTLQTALVRTRADTGERLDLLHLGVLGVGSIPSVIEPMLAFLDGFTQWMAGLMPETDQVMIPPADQPGLDHWRARLMQYKDFLLAVPPADRDKPNELVWRGVTLPLLAGYWYLEMPGVSFMSGATPPVKKPPDIIYPFSLFARAVWMGQNVSVRQLAIAELGDQAATATASVIEKVKQVGGAIAKGAVAVGKWALAALALLAVIYVAKD